MLFINYDSFALIKTKFYKTEILLIRWRIRYKLCVLMCAVHIGRCPAYLVDIVLRRHDAKPGADCDPHIPRTTSHHVCAPSSASRLGNDTTKCQCYVMSSNLLVLRRKTYTRGECTFSYAGPTGLNSLHNIDISSCHSRGDVLFAVF